ncbi:MAG: hypothetical protein GVY26_01630 [Bacteroidetes bacterium]|nr:hypothetical protein [Bacteroidota bacterium]
MQHPSTKGLLCLCVYLFISYASSAQYTLRLDQLRPALEKRFSSKSDAGDRLIFSGYRIGDMVKEINQLTDTRYAYHGQDEEQYDFIIRTTSDEALRESLKSYGLQWQVGSEAAEETVIEPR